MAEVLEGFWSGTRTNHFLELNEGQVTRAVESLTLTPGAGQLRFRPNSLHAVARYLVPGQLWMFVASPGIGKTTFLLSAADDWLLAGKRVAFMGLEQEDDELRTAFACIRAGVNRAIAVENSWMEYGNGLEMYQSVGRHLESQMVSPLREQLLLLPQRYIDASTLKKAAQDAEDFGADVLIVDHLNHIKASSHNEFINVIQLSKRIAEDHGFVNLSAGQVNREAMKGGHRLTRYMPAQLHQLYGGSVIEQNAVVVLNAYRPLVVPTSEAMAKQILAAQKGDIEATYVLQKNRMGVAVLKHRIRGDLEGQRTILTLDNGKLTDTTT